MTQTYRITKTLQRTIDQNQADWVVQNITANLRYHQVRWPIYCLVLQRDGDKPITFYNPGTQRSEEHDEALYGGRKITHMILFKDIDFKRIALRHSDVDQDRAKFVLTPWSLVVKDGVVMAVGEHFDGEHQAGSTDGSDGVVEAPKKRKKDLLAPGAQGAS